jgi:NAD(P) transhydrogenase subunit alpha
MLATFALSCMVGYLVVSKVTQALHAPLMSVTNAISSIIIVPALDVVLIQSCPLRYFNMVAIFLTAINIVGGLELTRRMLVMFTSNGGGARSTTDMSHRSDFK